MTVNVDERIRQVDQVAGQASVSISRLTPEELELAQKLCEHFELQIGTLIRRADAIRLLGDTDTTVQRLQEAAQHLICR
jgi:hypothetical protein